MLQLHDNSFLEAIDWTFPQNKCPEQGDLDRGQGM